ncbi:MAG: hypothetical protein KA165_17970, partial [Saprospiraceae bacterium]|nr:hypothetical protein [Saprospiraceae bacterium]
MFYFDKLYFDLYKTPGCRQNTFAGVYNRSKMNEILCPASDPDVQPPRLYPEYKSTVLRAPTR